MNVALHKVSRFDKRNKLAISVLLSQRKVSTYLEDLFYIKASIIQPAVFPGHSHQIDKIHNKMQGV